MKDSKKFNIDTWLEENSVKFEFDESEEIAKKKFNIDKWFEENAALSIPIKEIEALKKAIKKGK